jgi:hypothetical protein
MESTGKIKELIKWFTPFGIMESRRKRKEKNHEEEIEKERKIKKYFQGLNRKNVDPEVLEIIEYFDYYPFSVFPYYFARKYDPSKIEVYFDKASKMRYVLHDNKRMYFPYGWSVKSICDYYNSLLIEQDIDSPHRYETPEFLVQNGDVIADIGAAEGIWALTYAEKAKKIYLFECTQGWIAALKKTFEPWKEKITIINKYISNITQKGCITLDDFINEEGTGIDFIKADIEGMELNLIEGGRRTLTAANNLKLLLCTYHHQDDAEKMRVLLEAEGFAVENSKGYLLFIHDKELDEPYIRRGIIRAKKQASRVIGECR